MLLGHTFSLGNACRGAAFGTLFMVGNRNRPNRKDSTTTSLMRHHMLNVVTPFAGSNPTMQFDNAFLVSNGGRSSTNLTDFKLFPAIKHDGTIYQGSNYGDTLDPGDDLTSLAELSFDAGDTLEILYDLEFIGAGTHRFPTNAFTAGNKDYVASGTNASQRVSDGTKSYSPVAFVTQIFAPTAIYATGVATRTYFFMGDSITRGSGDNDTGTSPYNDFISTQSSIPWINQGGMGFADKGVAGDYPIINVGVDGRNASTMTEANYSWLFDNSKGVTDIYLMGGTNDLIGGATGSTVVTRLINAVTVLRNRFPSATIYVLTIPPLTNSSDSWTTKGNQSFSGSVGGTTPDWTKFTDNTGTTGRSYVNAQIRAGNITGADGYIDVSARVEDSTDETYWLTENNNARTKDGIHPSWVGHNEMAEIIRNNVLGETNLIKNPWFADGMDFWSDQSASQGSSGTVTWNSNGTLNLNGNGSGNRAFAQADVVTGKNNTDYRLTFDVSNIGVGKKVYARIGYSGNLSYEYINDFVDANGTGTFDFTTIATSNIYVSFHSFDHTTTVNIDNVKLVEV